MGVAVVVGADERVDERHVSEHLTWDELHCWDRTVRPWRLIAVYPLDWRASRAVLLAREFEAVRAGVARRMGREVPLVVTSAYRTAAHNRRIGGSPKSQHLEGRALDLTVPAAVRTPETLRVLYTAALERAHGVLAIRGLGRYDTFVHVDTRPSAALVWWDERTRKDGET